MAVVQKEVLDKHRTNEEGKTKQNETNRKILEQLTGDLEVARSYVFDRDRPVEEIETEHGLPPGGVTAVLRRLQPCGLGPDR